MENSLDLLNFHKTLKPADPATIRQFTGILPDFLLEDWQNRGFASYLKGLLITTNPNDFYEILEGWVDEPKKCHVVMRSAFGEFYYYHHGDYYCRGGFHDYKSNLQCNLEVIIKFSLVNKSTQKYSLFNDIYKKVAKRLGEPGYDEMFGQVPLVSLGGGYSPDTMIRTNLKEHMAILGQFRK